MTFKASYKNVLSINKRCFKRDIMKFVIPSINFFPF